MYNDNNNNITYLLYSQSDIVDHATKTSLDSSPPVAMGNKPRPNNVSSLKSRVLSLEPSSRDHQLVTLITKGLPAHVTGVNQTAILYQWLQ